MEEGTHPVSFPLWGHCPGCSVYYLTILVCAGRLKFCSIFFRDEIDDLHPRCDRVPDSYGSEKLDLLREINGTMSWKKIYHHCGEEPDGEGTMGNSSFEYRFLRIGLVHMEGIKVTRRFGEIVNDRLRYGLGDLGRSFFLILFLPLPK